MQPAATQHRVRTGKAEGCSTAALSSPTAVSTVPTGSIRSTCARVAAGRSAHAAAWRGSSLASLASTGWPQPLPAATPTWRTPMVRDPRISSVSRTSCRELSGMLQQRAGGAGLHGGVAGGCVREAGLLICSTPAMHPSAACVRVTARPWAVSACSAGPATSGVPGQLNHPHPRTHTLTAGRQTFAESLLRHRGRPPLAAAHARRQPGPSLSLGCSPATAACRRPRRCRPPAARSSSPLAAAQVEGREVGAANRAGHSRAAGARQRPHTRPWRGRTSTMAASHSDISHL